MDIEKIKQLITIGTMIIKREGRPIMDKCFFCKGSMFDDTTNYVTNIGEHILIIKNVPCHKCVQCGEVSYTLEVSKRIEELVQQCSKMLQEISVIDYNKAA